MIQALSTISHNGVEYVEGDIFDAEEGEQALVDIGSAEFVNVPVEEKEIPLIERTRKKIESIAIGAGIDAATIKKYKNKAELIAAINSNVVVEEPAEDEAEVIDEEEE